MHVNLQTSSSKAQQLGVTVETFPGPAIASSIWPLPVHMTEDERVGNLVRIVKWCHVTADGKQSLWGNLAYGRVPSVKQGMLMLPWECCGLQSLDRHSLTSEKREQSGELCTSHICCTVQCCTIMLQYFGTWCNVLIAITFMITMTNWMQGIFLIAGAIKTQFLEKRASFAQVFHALYKIWLCHLANYNPVDITCIHSSLDLFLFMEVAGIGLWD